MEEIACVLKAISHETRLRVIYTLYEEKELNVSQLVDKIKCEQSLLSHHLTDMRIKGILTCRKKGKNCFYSLKDKQLYQVLDCLINIIKPNI